MNPEHLQERVRKELAAWPPRPDIWAYAVLLSHGDEAKSTEFYIKFRVAELQFADEVGQVARPQRVDAELAAPFAAKDNTLRPESLMGKFCWNLTARAISNDALFNLIIVGFVAVMSIAAIFLNTMGNRAWWLLLPVGQVANLYLAHRLTGYPLHLLAATKGAQARLQILLNIFVLTALLLFLSAIIPLVSKLG